METIHKSLVDIILNGIFKKIKIKYIIKIWRRTHKLKKHQNRRHNKTKNTQKNHKHEKKTQKREGKKKKKKA